MNCPQCNCPNPTGATHCQMCYEVFNKSAADRYLHAQRRARRNRENGEEAPAQTEIPPNPESLHTSSTKNEPHITRESNVGFPGQEFFLALPRFFKAHWKLLAQAVGLGVIGYLVLQFTSKETRLSLFGDQLAYAFPSNSTFPYLVTLRTDVKSWSEVDNRVDTPLPPVQRDEIGTLIMKASPPQKRAQYVVLQPKEWILTRSGSLTQNIPLSHASLKPLQATLKYHGSLLSRDGKTTTRIGRASAFLLPSWPTGRRRPGDTWEETVDWVDSLGEWAVRWTGKIRWEMTGFETRDGAPTAHLIYRADVRPSFVGVPEWAKKAVGKPVFEGSAWGDAYFDLKRNKIVSHDFDQNGTLRFPIDNVYRIPTHQRVGRAPRKRWGRPAPVQSGKIILQIKSKYGVHKS